MIRTTLFLVFCTSLVFGQDDITICHTSPTEKFALFASSAEFRASHQTPRIYTHVSQNDGKSISFKCPDGTSAQGYLIPAKNKTDNWVFVFQEWWGLNDNIKRHSEELYSSLGNVNVLALDMYDGKATDDREVAAKLIQAFTQERGDMIVKGALKYAGEKAKVATIGWCFGGGQSLLATLTAGKQAAGCVIYYGMPVEDVAVLRTLQADVLGIFAAREKRISPEVVKRFEENMKKASKNLVVKSYDAEHGFANPSNTIYDEEATEDAYKATVEFLRSRLR